MRPACSTRWRGPGGTFERVLETLGAPAAELGLPREPVVPAPGEFASVPQAYDVAFLPDHQWRTR
ncbi:hypothetical protein [Streptomyces luteolus]|uniref:Uncharacterized protein n=1 Tax=Streptomyces luteolus TaxID=3043615 RepID=A0ABT6T269_9ACTN|nr:hypothetical protein [Streptomyces sp. B-S-A12]MDI3421510.1 hypothetical protein [Streptomyces sp. B-S-A12]